MMPVSLLFWPFALLSVASTLMVLITRRPVYAVLYLVISLMAVAFVIYTLGAAPLAVFEVIVYAGAIMVFFLFVVMMLNLGTGKEQPDLRRATPRELILPGVFSGIIAIGLLTTLAAGASSTSDSFIIQLEDLGRSLFTTHFLGVKLASLVLLIATVGGMHLGSAADTASREAAAKDKKESSNGR